MIPKYIFQTHKSISYLQTKPKLLQCMYSWKRHSDFQYFFYTNEMCYSFIKTHFDEQVLKAYDKLPLAVMKADLWRYCILYHYGGIYADMDTICLGSPQLFLNESLLTIVPENETHLCNWVFSAPPKSIFLKKIIDLSTQRILENKIKGEHIIHYLTGPCVFTDGIEMVLKENNQPIFKNKKEYHHYPQSSLLRVFHPERFHKKIVYHLFTGQDNNGWINERNTFLI
jgi:mannosyltransferase OCH1-like enzyme